MSKRVGEGLGGEQTEKDSSEVRMSGRKTRSGGVESGGRIE